MLHAYPALPGLYDYVICAPHFFVVMSVVRASGGI